MSMTEADALATLGADEVSTVPEPQVSQEPVGATTPDSFTQLDPTTLPAELQSVYKSLQADYTKKTQEVAPWRQTFSDLGDTNPQDVRQAYEFWNNLNSDPEYANQVYSQLGEALKGYQQVPATVEPEVDEFANPLEAQVQTLAKQLQDMQDQQRYNAGAAELQRQEMALRSQNPTWQDDDFHTVYELSLAHNGNLVKAAEQYTTLQQRLITNYMNTKASVPAGIEPAGRASNAIDTQNPPSTSKEAHAQAYEYLKQSLGSN